MGVSGPLYSAEDFADDDFDTQDRLPYSPVDPTILVDLYFSGSTTPDHRFATRDIYVSLDAGGSTDTFYKGTLLTKDLQIEHALNNIWFGVEETSDISLEFANIDNGIDDTWDDIIAAEELRTATIRIQRHDVDQGVHFEARGKITAWEVGHVVRIDVELFNSDSLDTLLPPDVVEGGGLIDSFVAQISAAASDNSYNMLAYSFLDYGFRVGQTVDVSGFANGDNNGSCTVVSVIAHKMIVSDLTLVDEATGETVTMESTNGFSSTAQDVGAAIPVCFGYCRNVPLLHIRNDRLNNCYDYLIGYGPIEGIWEDTDNKLGVKRNGNLVPSTEYVFCDDNNLLPVGWHGVGTNPYSGYAFIRFKVEQRDFSGSYYQFTADVKGLLIGGATAERNFANVIEAVLNNSTWGLGESVNSESFDQAAIYLNGLTTTTYSCVDLEYSTIYDFNCDGAIIAKTAARDILDQLTFTCRAILEKNPDNEWQIWIDQPVYSALALGDNDGYYNNCRIEHVSITEATKAIKTAKVLYAIGLSEEEGSGKVLQLAINSGFGVDKEYTLPFVYEDLTAKKVLSYLYKMDEYGDSFILLKAGLEARWLNRGDVIDVTNTARGLSKTLYRIDHITKQISNFTIEARSYDSRLYDDVTINDVPLSIDRNIFVAGPRALVGSITLGDGDSLAGSITLEIAPDQGDVFLAAGKTDFTTTDNGFIIGIDDSDGDKVKVYFGNATSYFYWNEDDGAVMSGSITAASGSIGGWEIGADYIRDAAGVVGLSSAVTAGDDIRFWAGHATPASAPFRVTEAGVLTASGVVIDGDITATTGEIGGWVVISDAIYKLDSGTPASSPNNGMTLEIDGGTNSKAVFRVYDGATLNAALGNYADGKYGVYAIEGLIGGWTLSATELSSTQIKLTPGANAEILLGSDVSSYANAAIGLKNDGSGKLASGNISWTTAGLLTAEFDSGGTITLNAGADIMLVGGTSLGADDAKIYFYQADGAFELFLYSDRLSEIPEVWQYDFYFGPDSSLSGTWANSIIIGRTPGPYDSDYVKLYAKNTISLTCDNGVNSTILTMNPTYLDVRGAAVFNEAGADYDFRIEGDTDTSLFFCDAGVDRIGIGAGVGNPSAKLHIDQASSTAAIPVLLLDQGDDDKPFFQLTGTTAASAAKSLSSWTNATIAGFARIAIDTGGGAADFWMPIYNAPTS